MTIGAIFKPGSQKWPLEQLNSLPQTIEPWRSDLENLISSDLLDFIALPVKSGVEISRAIGPNFRKMRIIGFKSAPLMDRMGLMITPGNLGTLVITITRYIIKTRPRQ